MTGVKEGGVKGRTDSTVCQTMNAAKNGSCDNYKKENVYF